MGILEKIEAAGIVGCGGAGFPTHKKLTGNIEYLIVNGGQYENQHRRYAAMPMNGYDGETESLEYNGTIYTVIKANTYSSKIGENKSRTDVDPYTSAVPFTNLIPVCKITNSKGNLLYRHLHSPFFVLMWEEATLATVLTAAVSWMQCTSANVRTAEA